MSSALKTGRTALAISAGEAFEIILLDVMLLHTDGMQVARQLHPAREARKCCSNKEVLYFQIGGLFYFAISRLVSFRSSPSRAPFTVT